MKLPYVREQETSPQGLMCVICMSAIRWMDQQPLVLGLAPAFNNHIYSSWGRTLMNGEEENKIVQDSWTNCGDGDLKISSDNTRTNEVLLIVIDEQT